VKYGLLCHKSVECGSNSHDKALDGFDYNPSKVVLGMCYILCMIVGPLLGVLGEEPLEIFWGVIHQIFGWSFSFGEGGFSPLAV
jgi:hypothetical protein